MKIALAQINPIIGNFKYNKNKILDFTLKALALKADLVVFPELCLCGYPPMDLLDYNSFLDENLKYFRTLQQSIPDSIGVVIGYVSRNYSKSGKKLINAASLIYNKEILLTQAKTLLPSYNVFYEARYFEPAKEHNVIKFKGERIGISICEDIWWEQKDSTSTRYFVDPVNILLDKGISLLLVPSASPYYSGKNKIRFELLSKIGCSSGVPVVYVNMAGGNDSLVFDGQSMVTSNNGKLIKIGKAFEEDLILIDREELHNPKNVINLSIGERVRKEEDYKAYDFNEQEVEKALILGLRDYLSKCGFKKVHLGLSGGIDSAIVAVIAVKALGPDKVTALALPSEYSSKGSIDDAESLSKNLGITLETVPIKDIFSSFLTGLNPLFSGLKEDVTEENLQARIRGTLLMAYSNKFNSLLLATGNKSELSTGYCTLYGDMNGGLSVIGDLFKTEVYALAKHINNDKEIIPTSTITKPPSAELKPDQKDEDNLPPYDILDRILYYYLIENLTVNEIITKGCNKKTVNRILKMVARCEYKRRQAAPVIKVSPRAYGTGRRIPIARYIYEAGG